MREGMLIALLLVLSTVRINSESVDQDGLRKSRQLDLSLQDIRNPDETATTIRLPSSSRDGSGYLPSVSSSESISAQSQQAFDFKSINSVEKGQDLCKPPSNESCDFKLSSEYDSKISKPSRDLVPPFNDLEQELVNKATTLSEKTNEKLKTTIETQSRIFTTITQKSTANIYKPTATQNVVKIIKTTGEPKPVPNAAEATNELRSYLPPQPDISPAAQTNVAVVQPARQNNQEHHDHHHHHHGENFNICDDAFHAFLCAPLKTRKRITGALPSNLQGQSSFINYQKALPKPDRDPAPSNTFTNEYLPPKPSPTNFIQSTSRPPLTTRKLIVITTTTTTTPRPYSPPKFVSEPSFTNEKFYLPPVINNSPPIKPASSNQAFSTVKSTTTPTPSTFRIHSKATSQVTQNSIFSSVPTVPIFNSLASNANNFYLPPDPNPQPSASFVSTSKNVFPISTVSPLPSTDVPVSIVTNFASFPSNSISITQKPKLQTSFPIFTTVKQPAAKIQSFPTTVKPIVRVPSFAPQPSSPGGSYLPPNEFQSASKPIPTTVKPSTNVFKFSEPSNPDRSYLPPDPKEPAAAQITSAAVAAPQVKNPFHHGRDLCTDPFHSFLCVSAKPRKRITGQLPAGYRPESSNTNESRLKPESSNQDKNKVIPDKPLVGAPAENVGYKYPKPINPLPTPSNVVSSTSAPTTGYSYPKPKKIFPLPSQQNVEIAPPTTTRKPQPALLPSETRVVEGYEYPKPEKIFPLPVVQVNTQVPTTTSPQSTTGYTCPKPQKPFPLSTEQKEIRQKPTQKSPTSSEASLILPTNTVKGYQYPKPEQSLKLPEKKGYSYPKPEKRLELPTETLGSRHKLPQSHSNLEALGNLGYAEFIPVNKLDDKRRDSSSLVERLKRFGERMRKRERETQLYKKLTH